MSVTAQLGQQDTDNENVGVKPAVQQQEEIPYITLTSWTHVCHVMKINLPKQTKKAL